MLAVTSAYKAFIIMMIILLAPIVEERNRQLFPGFDPGQTQLNYTADSKSFNSEGDSITPTVYYFGSEGSSHDVYYAGLVEGAAVEFGSYCLADPDIFELIFAYPIDVVISGRDDSVWCLYNHEDLPSIPVAGYGNYNEYHADDNPHALVISHGAAYGPAIDYCVDASSMSEAMPLFANDILKIQAAVRNAGLPPLGREAMRHVLDQSSTAECREGDRYWGKIINVDRAREIATRGLDTSGYANNRRSLVGALSLYLMGEE